MGIRKMDGRGQGWSVSDEIQMMNRFGKDGMI